MIQPILLVIAGLVVLLAAGEVLVRGAASLAKIANIPSLVIGLTVVAFGTSAPELVVTIQAVLGEAEGIALGNIVGSNIANILLVLGLPATFSAISTKVPRLRRHGVALVLSTALFAGLVYIGGQIGPVEAGFFTLGMLLYFALMAYEARQNPNEGLPELEELTTSRMGLPKTLAFVAAGLVGLPMGATLLVTNGKELASLLGVRDEIIGLTVVAFGTSLPELATVMAAALKKEADVIAGSIVGSNIFNMLFVGSAAGYAGVSRFSQDALDLDLPVMLAATAAFALVLFARREIGLGMGVVASLCYIGYIVKLGIMGLQ